MPPRSYKPAELLRAMARAGVREMRGTLRRVDGRHEQLTIDLEKTPEPFTFYYNTKMFRPSCSGRNYILVTIHDLDAVPDDQIQHHQALCGDVIELSADQLPKGPVRVLAVAELSWLAERILILDQRLDLAEGETIAIHNAPIQIIPEGDLE